MKLDTTNWPLWKEEKPTPETNILLYESNYYIMLEYKTDKKLYRIDHCFDHEFTPDEDAKWIELSTTRP